MKVSTKGRYGLRLMTDLAVYHEQGLVPLKEIAARQDISEKYLEQIMMQLNRSGLVRSVRGARISRLARSCGYSRVRCARSIASAKQAAVSGQRAAQPSASGFV